MITILLTYSFVQGFISAGYIYSMLKKPFLAIALASVSLLILVYLYESNGWFLDYPQLIWVFPPIWYCIGPAYYLFTRKYFGYKLRTLDILHLLPIVVFYIYLFPFYLLESDVRIAQYQQFWDTANYTVDIHHYFYQIHLLVYAFFSYRQLQSSEQKLKNITSNSSIISIDFVKRIILLLLVFCGVGLGYYISVDLKIIPPVGIYTPILYLALSLLIHLTTYYTWSDTNLAADETIAKYTASGLDESRLNEIVNEVNKYIGQEQVFKNPDLRLKDVSEALNIPSHHISQAINSQLSKTFFDLINEHRVKALKENINSEKFKNYTLVAVAEEFGFKSSSSFFRIFKKVTGLTPKEYLKSTQ
ncbi:MAG: helix-turn-helix domain-containing protein [Fulvivirga sp.]|uniref:helix-turn-helix domain-containing protein n=1 Tax=Fulvivirga sp. TaxID=1931237 RepID=UPI0032EF6E95